MIFNGVYAITDSKLLADDKLLASVEQALEGGIRLLQYRNKTADWQSRLEQAIALQRLCDKYQVPLIINDDIQLCLASAASGVHIGQSDAGIVQARTTLGAEAIIGVTCHASIERAQQAQQAGADYVAFGRFYPSLTKPEAPTARLDVLSQAKENLSIPMVAIGGINADNGAAAIAAGADMLAVINYLFAGDQVKQRAQQLANLF